MKATLHKPKPKVVQIPNGTENMEVGMTIAQTERVNDRVVRVDDRVWEVVEICEDDDYRKLNGLKYVIAKYEHVDYFDQPTGRVSHVIFLGKPKDQHWWMAESANVPFEFRKRLTLRQYPQR